MKARVRRYASGSLAAAALQACSYHAYSPPPRAMPLDSAAVLEDGERSVALEAAQHGTVFGPDLGSVAGRLRAGVGDQLELSVETTMLHVEDTEGTDTHPNIYAAHGGARYGALRHLSLNLGAGLGASAGGGFVAPDAGVTFAYENRWLVPFASLRGYASLPVYSRAVHLGDEFDEDTEAFRQIRDRPRPTVGAQIAAGLRVPLRSSGEERGSLHLGIGATEMADREAHDTFATLAVGLSLLL